MLKELGEKIKAVAEKFEIDGEKVLAYLHTEVDHLLGLADDEADAAKAHIEQVVAKDEAKVQATIAEGAAAAEAEVEKVETDVSAAAAEAPGVIQRLSAAINKATGNAGL